MENRRPTSARSSGQKKYYAKPRETQVGYGRYHDRDQRDERGPRVSSDRGRNDRGGPRGNNDRTNRGQSGPKGNVAARGRGEKGGQRRDRSKYPPPRPGSFAARKPFGAKGKASPPWKKEERIKITSDLQVTDGKYRGMLLENSASPRMKSTVRRLREIMFKILSRRVRAGRVLDLCAGNGIIGIEAVSRGAMAATFVDRSAKMCSFIQKNLDKCSIKKGHGEIAEIEVQPFLKRAAKRGRVWDVVYYSPPFDSDYEEILDFFRRGKTLSPGSVLLIEHPSEMFFPEKLGGLKRWRVILQGDSALSFYQKK